MGRNNELLNPLVGDVPYLNGGLFEKTDQDRADFTIDDAAFTKIWDNLFSRYNFTVAESTPDDQDVAVDPEMLGKVFEELVTGRHESGSYYTPRPIVQFMCREALKGYLAPCGSGIEEFVDFHDASGITNHEAVLAALRSVKVVDPACGSGAYLLGMLQELMALRLSLFNAKRLDDKLAYARKLEIIQNNLYGVDLDAFAVNTARLRLWLSLVVEDQRNPLADRNAAVALPNLDFKIEQGDSVCCPDPSGGLQLDLFRENDLRELASKQRQHGDVNYHGDKHALKREIDALARAIKVESKLDENAFDWRVDFGGVFQPQEPVADLGGALNLGGTLAAPAEAGGFDVVLANPPYVRGELIKDLKPVLKRVYGERFGGTMDLYCFFYFRAVELLRDGGLLVFITPNKWFTASYGAKLRSTISDRCSVRSITDFGYLPVFDSATAYPMIFIAEKGCPGTKLMMLTRPLSLSPPYPDVRAVVKDVGLELPPSVTAGSEWTLRLLDRTVNRSGANMVTLDSYVDGKVFYGIKTGLNAAFVIDSDTRDKLILSDSRNNEILRPLATGRDVKRWVLPQLKQWLIVTKSGADITRYPAVLDHLMKWEAALKARQDQGNNYWELRACAYYDAFDKPKIIYPQIMSSPQFAFDAAQTYTNQKCFFISSSDKYLLGVLNSSTFWRFIAEGSPELRGGFSEPRKDFMLSQLIPRPTAADESAVASLVQQCLDKNGVAVAELETEINERVAALYGL